MRRSETAFVTNGTRWNRRLADRGLSGSKVELLFLGAFGAGEKVESEIGSFGFDEELFYGAEELGGFFGEAGGKEEAKDAGIVVAEIDLLAGGEFDG